MVFGALPDLAEQRVIAVLPAAACIPARRLDVAIGPGADPDIRDLMRLSVASSGFAPRDVRYENPLPVRLRRMPGFSSLR